MKLLELLDRIGFTKYKWYRKLKPNDIWIYTSFRTPTNKLFYWQRLDTFSKAQRTPNFLKFELMGIEYEGTNYIEMKDKLEETLDYNLKLNKRNNNIDSLLGK